MRISKRIVVQQHIQKDNGCYTKNLACQKYQDLNKCTDNMNNIDYSQYKVLVVDDIPVNIVLLKTMLARLNVIILSAKNGQEALDIINESRPDLVLLDVHMPVIDGLEVLKKAKTNPEMKNMDIIMVSAFTAPEDIQKAMELGASAYITKPIILDDFLERVTTSLGNIK